MTGIDALLAPLPDPAPCGPDLSLSADFDRIAELRRADDPTLPQGEWKTELKSADWPAVASLCADLLALKTKDLRVATWLLEAWAKLRGYAGLADGIELARGLCERFWVELHPQPEGADFDLRVGALARLVAQIGSLALALPIVGQDASTYSLRDIEAARARGAAPARGHDAQAAGADGRATMDDIAGAERGTPADVIRQRLDGARRARQSLQLLQSLVDERLGAEGPGFTAAREALDGAIHAMERMVPDQPSEAAVAGSPAAGAPAPVDSAAAGFGAAPGTRAQALAQLRQVASFFRATEPHSPVAYLAERAAHWGELPLHAWLRLVVKDGGTLEQLEELLGVPRRTE